MWYPKTEIWGTGQSNRGDEERHPAIESSKWLSHETTRLEHQKDWRVGGWENERSNISMQRNTDCRLDCRGAANCRHSCSHHYGILLRQPVVWCSLPSLQQHWSNGSSPDTKLDIYIVGTTSFYLQIQSDDWMWCVMLLLWLNSIFKLLIPYDF